MTGSRFVAQMAEDWRRVDLPDREQAMLDYVEKIATSASTIAQERRRPLEGGGLDRPEGPGHRSGCFILQLPMPPGGFSGRLARRKKRR